MPEVELVDSLAITAWRKRRIIRHEVALIETRHEWIDEDLESDPSVPPRLLKARSIEAKGCNVGAITELLEKLDGFEANCKLDPRIALGAFNLICFSGFEGLSELSAEDFLACFVTAGGFREWIANHWATEEIPYKVVVQLALQEGRDIQADEALRKEAIEKCRLQRERAALMPSVDDMDNLVRHEAHLDRSFARGLSQLELLQRLRNGQNVPPPERVEVTIN